MRNVIPGTRTTPSLAVIAFVLGLGMVSCHGPKPARPSPTTARSDGVAVAPEAPAQRPPAATSSLPLQATARSLAGLFGIASQVVTGELRLDREHESGEMDLLIGETRVAVGGDGIKVPQAETARIRLLVGRNVTAGFNVRHWSMGDSRVLMGDGSRLCLASEEEMAPLVTIRQRLEQTDMWFPDTLVMETGVWERFLADLPTAEGAMVTEQVYRLLDADQRALAGDIISWFSRTHDAKFEPLPHLRYFLPGRAPPVWVFDDRRLLATVVLEAALGLQPRTLIREQWRGLGGCRRLWMLFKILDGTPP